MTDIERYTITSTDEYKAYLKALCRIASEYVSRIRVQFAEKAFDKYQDETLRRIVLTYGEEAEKLDEQRLFDFRCVSQYGAKSPDSLDDFCLNKAAHYAQTVFMLFDIE